MRKTKLNMFMLVMINLATTLSIKNWPFLSEYGLTSALFFFIAMIVFFVPVSLVAAELASGWPEKEGVFGWVKEAFNEKWGFLAVWLLWIENVIWYPTMFAFIVSTLSYAFSSALAANALYNVMISLSLFWLVLVLNLGGVKFSGWISTVAVIVGTLVPGVLLIAFGSHHIVSVLSWDAFCEGSCSLDFSWAQLGVLASMALAFAGMEMNAVYAKEVKNPKRTYPHAIFISGAVIVVLTAVGTVAVGAILPKGELNYVLAIVQTCALYLKQHNVEYFLPVLAVMVALGSLGGISAWLTGTSKSLLVGGRGGQLPPFLCRENKHQVPVPILLLQGIIGSLMCVVFVTMPSLSSGFWTLTILATQLYLLMYMLMFAAAITLRFKQPNVQRPYHIPGGSKMGMIAVAGMGFISCILFFGIGFIPPSFLSGFYLFLHEGYLIGGCIFFSCLPFILRAVVKRFSIEKKSVF